MENSKRQRGRRVLGLKDVTPRRDEKSAEVIDTQRVVSQPLRKRVSKPLKRKGLNEKKAEMEVTRGEQGGICEWQTHGRIAQKYSAYQLLSGYHSNGATNR